VCFTDKPGSKCLSLEPCHHVFCRECLTESCRLLITEGSVTNLKCMMPDCTSQLHPAQVSVCLSVCTVVIDAVKQMMYSWSVLELYTRSDYTSQTNGMNKKAVLSQRWPRDARYISRSWAVAEIWPFKIIQDGDGRHLEFVRIENSAIRSAVPENPTLEQNMKWIGRPVVEIWPFEIFQRWRPPPSWICSNRK